MLKGLNSVLTLLVLLSVGSVTASADSIVAWGDDDFGLVSGTPTGSGCTAVAGGEYTSYALAAVPEPSDCSCC